MLGEVLLGSAREGLLLRSDGRGDLTARLTHGGLTAETSVYAYSWAGFDGLDSYFADMLGDWRGWNGERAWSSLEGELGLAARHDGHVRIRVSLQDSTHSTWTATAELKLDAGEQLAEASRGLTDLFK